MKDYGNEEDLVCYRSVFGLAGTANAFTNAAPLPIDKFTHLECVPSYEQPRTRDRNPVYKIVVNLQLNEVGNDVTELTAAHVLADGTMHNRNDQYEPCQCLAKEGLQRVVLEWNLQSRPEPEDGRPALPHHAGPVGL